MKCNLVLGVALLVALQIVFCSATTAGGSWATLPSMHDERQFGGAAYLNGMLYAVGGYTANSITNSVEAMNTTTRTWKYVAPMKYARYKLGVTAAAGKVYAVGGYMEGPACGSSAVVEAYNPATNTWTEMAPLPTPISLAGVTSYGDQIFVVGGQSCDGSPLSSLYIYNVTTNKWKSGSSMPVSIYKLSATGGPGYEILALGGYDKDGAVSYILSYDIGRDRWTKAFNTLPTPLYDFAAVTMNYVVFVMGGLNNNADDTANTWYASFNVNATWLAGPALPQTEEKFAAACDNYKTIYTIGQGAEAYAWDLTIHP